MIWEQIRVDCAPEMVDLIADQLIELGTGGVQWLDDETTTAPGNDRAAVLAYLPAAQELTDFLQKLDQRLQSLQDQGFLTVGWRLSTRQVDDQKGALAWESYYHVQHLTRFITVVPQWEDHQPTTNDEIVIRLDPGRSFGTGMHPTTRLAVSALELSLRPGRSVFDVGTGSGILSLVAWRLGASTIQATELDENALAFTEKNLRLNHGEAAIKLMAGSLLTPVEGRADLIIANMLPEALLPLIPQLTGHLQPEGQVILTGIINTQLPKIQNALTQAGFVVDLLLQAGDWFCLRCQKEGES
ncbi:50S ribosomal protein L11 methyltransferase [Lapidilactobacillus luobeiensis]|uniref:50S ribosomal protein L11 methyltransferase n=1 Tax=Lapidilactobacillus luobeiensis TaxID=2950371 RepID=UPI0021C2F854|nr:50S ribosomal protein L11 methyltransferase [Lapidilactobacillus luobeiensis]